LEEALPGQQGALQVVSWVLELQAAVVEEQENWEMLALKYYYKRT